MGECCEKGVGKCIEWESYGEGLFEGKGERKIWEREGNFNVIWVFGFFRKVLNILMI